MVIKLTNQPAYPLTRAAQAGISPRFKGAAASVSSAAIKDVEHLDAANKIMNGIRKLGINNKDIRVGGLSLEDISGRLQTIIGVYLLQGYFAYKDNKHPWETNGRNAVVWLMTFGLTTWSKSDSYGANTMIFNHFMKEKGTPNKIPFMQALLDTTRMDVDYLKILEKAGVSVSDKDKEAAMKGNKALWSASWLDSNKIMRIQNYEKELKAKGANLNKEEAKMLEAIPKFFHRVNLANIGSTALITGATIYLIGVVAMQIVNKLFTPLDKDTGMASVKSKTQAKNQAKTEEKDKPAAASPAPQNSQPALQRPVPQFSSYRPALPANFMAPNRSWPTPVMMPNFQYRPVLPMMSAYQPGGLN